MDWGKTVRQVDSGIEARLRGLLRREEKRMDCSLGIPFSLILSSNVGESEHRLYEMMTNRTHYLEIKEEKNYGA